MPEKCLQVADTRSTFGRNLRKLRMIRGLTQDDLANLSGMMQRYVSQLETSISSPKLDTLRRLAAAFGMTTDEFIRQMEAAA